MLKKQQLTVITVEWNSDPNCVNRPETIPNYITACETVYKTKYAIEDLRVCECETISTKYMIENELYTFLYLFEDELFAKYVI